MASPAQEGAALAQGQLSGSTSAAAGAFPSFTPSAATPGQEGAALAHTHLGTPLPAVSVPAAGAPVKAAPAPSHGGGTFGFLNSVPGVGAVEHAVGQAAHVGAQTVSGLANDALNAPGQLATVVAPAFGHDVAAMVEHPLRQEGPTFTQLLSHPLRGGDAHGSELFPRVIQPQLASIRESATHPLRDPAATVLNAIAAASVAGGALSRAGAVGEAAKAGSAGDVARAIVEKPHPAARLIQARKGDETRVPLLPSTHPVVRAGQGLHDVIGQRALLRNPEGRVGSYMAGKIGHSLEETQRRQTAMAAAPAARLEASGAKAGGRVRGAVTGGRAVQQAALRLTAEQRTPEEALAFHHGQLTAIHDNTQALTRTADPAERVIRAEALKGLGAPTDHLKQVELLQHVRDQGLVARSPDGHVVINPDHAKLAKLDARLAHAGTLTEHLAGKTGARSADALQARIDAPNAVHGVDRAGRQYVPYYRSETKGAPAGVTPGTTPIVGGVRPAIPGHEFTGASIKQGAVPDNTTRLVAAHLNRLTKQLSTEEFRRTVPGSATRLTKRDVLVNTQELKNAVVPDDLKTALGARRGTLDELAGQHAAMDALKQNIVPKLAPTHDSEGNLTPEGALPHDAPNGTPAPEGYKWVDKKMLGELGRPSIPLAGKIAKKVDALNSGVTAATVYYKIGHVATRGVTDLATNAVEGSLNPRSMGRSFNIWRSLTEQQRDAAISGVGGGGFTAMPHEGDTKLLGVNIGGVARTGSAFWARRFDAPSRFLNLTHIAAKSGFGSPEKFKAFLRESADPKGLSDAQRATIDGIWKNANRASIQYDKLSDFEKRYLSRAIWFFPWLRGSTKFAGRTLIEHPVKAAVIGRAGQAGTAQQLAQLGPQPSYNAGIFKVGGSAANPLTANFNTLSPFSTPGQIAESALHANRPTQAQQLMNQFSPALAAGGGAAYHVNQFGAASKASILHNFFSQLIGTTPEAALLKALTATPGNQSRKMFPATTTSGLERFFGGSAVPRTMNRAVANTAAQAEKTAAGR